MTTGTTTGTRVGALGEVEHEIGVLVRRVRRAVAERAGMVHPDLHPVEYLVLTTIAGGAARAGEVGAALCIDKSAMSRCVQHLLELGLLERTPDPDDGRAQLLSLTAEGRQRVEAIDGVRRQALDDRLADWSADDLHELITVLRRYNATFA